ncbi:transporter [Microvirga aerophila]|uniref:Transporter n=1 Tax=Microvirga aerophila TaxID=670291 RepID=A0A512BXM2_9HYPH|nr:transporter [Microvirga aerophila]
MSVLAAGSAWAQQKEPIKIGSLWSLTGPAAPFGIAQRDTIEILVNNINKDGGVNGHPVQVVNYDEASNPIEAARGATQLIQQHGVVAILGASTGSGSLAAAPILARNKVPLVSTNSTATVTSKQHSFFPWLFRVVVSDTDILKSMTEQAAGSGAKSIALFYQEDAYGQEGAKVIEQLAPELGMKVVGTAAAPTNATDVASQATKLRNASPDAVAIVTSSPVLAAAFARASSQVGLKASLWGGVGLGQKAFLDGAGPAGSGLRAVLLANWDEPAPGLSRLGKVLTEGGKPPIGVGEPIASSALLVLVEALKKDPTAKGEALRKNLEGLCGVKTYSEGEICFNADDHDGAPPEALVSVIVEGGKFKNAK